MKATRRPLRILIVENETLLATLIVNMVEDAGWQVAGMAQDLQHATALATTAVIP